MEHKLKMTMMHAIEEMLAVRQKWTRIVVELGCTLVASLRGERRQLMSSEGSRSPEAVVREIRRKTRRKFSPRRRSV